MSTRCIDIADNKKVGTTSPISIVVWIFLFLILNAFVDLGFSYLIFLLVITVFVMIFFQYKPRYIFLLLRMKTKNSYFTPSFPDVDYIADETKIKNIAAVMNTHDITALRNKHKK